MLKLEKIKQSGIQGYFYHPENTDDVGMIEIIGSDAVISIESNHDKKLGIPYYGNKARAEVLRLLKDDNLVEAKLLIWY